MARKALEATRSAVQLTADHTHAGRTYPPGTVLVLADVDLHPESAQWLVTLNKARWVEPEAAAPAETTVEE